MSLKSILTTLLIVSIFSTAGCSGQDSEGNQTGGEDNMATKTQTQLFPKPEFPEIEFTATKRPQPKSIDEAERTIQQIRALYDWSQVPQALNRDLTLDGLYEYLKAMKLLTSQVPHDIAWLKELEGIKVPGTDKFTAQSIDNAKGSALGRLQDYLPRDIEHSTKHTREFILSSFKPRSWEFIRKSADCDMSNQSQIRNLLTREDVRQYRANDINRLAIAIEGAILFDDVMGIDSDWSNERKELRDLVERYSEKLEMAADAIQPPVDIGDATLMKIAKEVLGNQRYKLPKSERVIVNAPKKSFGKDHYTIDFGERSIEKSPYRWEEFQVATIEKEGDQHYVYYNTIINYSIGPHTVPTGKWVLGPRHKSTPISAENINN